MRYCETMQRSPFLADRPDGPTADVAFARSDLVCADLLPAIRSAQKDDDGRGDDQVGVATKTRAKPKKPSMFKVLMLNDDFTPMEFVVMVLKRFFQMDMDQATRVMLHVHQRGVGVCGIFSFEIAETKVNQVMDCARDHQHPLRCTLEKA